jgi:hypothetical protein
MAGRISSRGAAAAIAAFSALGLALGGAYAADNADAVKHDAASSSKIVGAGSGSGGGSPNTIVDPANGGVAGTGLGKTSASPKGGGAGTGQSVGGSTGQGISNSTDTGK